MSLSTASWAVQVQEASHLELDEARQALAARVADMAARAAPAQERQQQLAGQLAARRAAAEEIEQGVSEAQRDMAQVGGEVIAAERPCTEKGPGACGEQARAGNGPATWPPAPHPASQLHMKYIQTSLRYAVTADKSADTVFTTSYIR